MSDAAQSPDFLIPIGKAKVEREGKDVSIITFSKMVGTSLDAAKQLAEEGISVEVINLRYHIIRLTTSSSSSSSLLTHHQHHQNS
jgi:pyruvate/2-oxoglutarate/acetoin dehydrogenase E1 component